MEHTILIIQKKFQITSDFVRYYTVKKICLNDYTMIQTEADLCRAIFQQYGVGIYLCLAFQRGHKGFWNFWNGSLYSNGFMRFKRHSQGDVEEISEFDIRQELYKNKNYRKLRKRQWRGPKGLLSVKPGILYPYDLKLKLEHLEED